MARQYINEKFPHFLHGADYNPEQWIDTPEIWDADMELMKEANCNEMSVGIFSWAMLEPEEGKYDFSFLDTIVDKVYAAGGRVVLATPSGARPRWMAEKYPEVLRVNQNRQRFGFGERHNHCYTSPVYREKVRQMNTLLAQRYGKQSAVVAWHISNEYGGACYCDKCQNAFRDYLRQRYHNDIHELNHAWWSTFWSHRYDNFDQIEAPTALTDRSIHGLNLDWRRFVTHQTVDFMKQEIAAIKAISPDIPVTTNMMLGYYELNYHEFAPYLDVISWDSYPDWHSHEGLNTAYYTAFWHDFFRSMKKKPFMLMESAPGLVNWKPVNKLKRPGMDTLASLQAVAHGSDTVQYFQWRKSRGSVEKFHGAVVDHVGTKETRIFNTVKRTGELLKIIDEVAGSNVVSRVALVFDWENMWALDDSQGFQKDQKKYYETCYSYYKLFWEKGISVDIVRAESDWSGYDLVVAPMLYMVSEKTARKMADFVENGGHLYATYMLGMVNETDLCHLGGFPCGELKNVFGIWNEEIDSPYPEERVAVSGGWQAKDYCELIHPRGAEVKAVYESEFYAGMPAFTVNAYGKGKAYYQAFRHVGDFAKAQMGQILQELGIVGTIPDTREGVTAHKRCADGAEYLFVENYNGEEVRDVSLGGAYTDMESGEKLQSVTLPAYGIRVLER